MGYVQIFVGTRATAVTLQPDTRPGTHSDTHPGTHSDTHPGTHSDTDPDTHPDTPSPPTRAPGSHAASTPIDPTLR